MNLVLFGPPAAGKGTQAQLLVVGFGLRHLSGGDLLRREVVVGSPLGYSIDLLLRQGSLVPDAVIITLIANQLKTSSGKDNILLDGFPRTLAQAKALDGIMNVDLALQLDVPLPDVLQRMAGRLVCQRCGTNFNTRFQPPLLKGVCDRCGGSLHGRQDDTDETIKKRYEIYLQQTQDALNYYGLMDRLVKVDGRKDPQQVYQALCAAINAKLGLG